MFQLYLIHDLAESFAIELFLQLLCRAGCNADDILRCSIFVVVQPDGEVPLSDINDDSGSDEQIVSLCLSLFYLNQSAEWFGLTLRFYQIKPQLFLLVEILFFLS